MSAPVTIRPALAHDAAALRRLAALDSASPPRGAVLLAEVEGELWAALPLDGGPAIGDPFRPSGDLVRLLELRASQLTGGDGRRPRSRRRRPSPSVRGAPRSGGGTTRGAPASRPPIHRAWAGGRPGAPRARRRYGRDGDGSNRPPERSARARAARAGRDRRTGTGRWRACGSVPDGWPTSGAPRPWFPCDSLRACGWSSISLTAAW